MEALLATAVLAAAGALAWWTPAWRRRRALARPFAPAGRAIVERNVPQYRGMPPALRRRLERRVQEFLYDKKFVGCAGLVVDDEMRLTIAAQACLLVLQRDGPPFPALDTVLLYPGAFLVPRREVDAAGVVTEGRQDLLGESWGDGRVVLSWEHVRRAGQPGGAGHERPGHERPGHERPGHDRPGHNVVLHEFAHQLDSESGSTNGAPYLGSSARYRSWSEVLAREYASLRHEAWHGQAGVLDHYGATSPAEFFAVATESFFEQPWALADRHPALFDEFAKYYRLDPREWSGAPAFDAPPAEPAPHGMVYGQWQ